MKIYLEIEEDALHRIVLTRLERSEIMISVTVWLET